MIRAQKQILQRFEKTNEMLSNCNTLSVSRLKIANQQFKSYKQLLVDVKKDLDYTFKKINVMKAKLHSQYPDSVAATSLKADETNQDCSEITNLSAFDIEKEKNTPCSQVHNSCFPVNEVKSQIEQVTTKIEASDSNSSESGEADSQVESGSISTSDTA